MVKTVIAGSRHLDDVTLVHKAIAASGIGERITEVVCGGAFGVDTSGALWAMENDVPVATYNADWKTHGKAAGPIRNGKMADYADVAIIVWDGESRGTANMIEQMRRRGKPAYVTICGIGVWTSTPPGTEPTETPSSE